MNKRIFIVVIACLNFSLIFAQDFIVEGVSNIEKSYKRLQPFSCSIKVKNIGQADTKNFSVSAVYFSKDKVLNKNEDYYASSNGFWGLKVGESKQESVYGAANQFGINVEAGNYYVIVEADSRNEITETDENNNVYVLDQQITVQDSDVDITSNGWVVKSESTLNFGDEFQISVSFINQGQDNVHSVWYEFFLSTDEIIDENDSQIGWLHFGHFNWTNKAAEYDEIPIPNTIIKDDYNVLMRINSEGQEIDLFDKNMDNNIFNVGQVHVNGIPIATGFQDETQSAEYTIVNPFRDKIIINNISNRVPVNLYTISGKLIYKGVYDKPIDGSNLKPGIYVLNIDSKSYKIIKK